MDALVFVIVVEIDINDAEVRVSVLAALQLNGEETVIAPVPPPVDPTVEIVTLQGALSRPASVVALIVSVAAVSGVNVLVPLTHPLKEPPLFAAPIVILVGSRRSIPICPRGAPV